LLLDCILQKALAYGKVHLGLALPAGSEPLDAEPTYEFEYANDEDDSAPFWPSSAVSIDTDSLDDDEDGARPQHMAEIVSMPLLPVPEVSLATAPDTQQEQSLEQDKLRSIDSSSQGGQWQAEIALLSKLPIGLALQQSIVQPAAFVAADVAQHVWQSIQQLEQRAAEAVKQHNLFSKVSCAGDAQTDEDSMGSQAGQDEALNADESPQESGGLTLTVRQRRFTGLLPAMLKTKQSYSAEVKADTLQAAAMAEAVLKATLGSLQQGSDPKQANQALNDGLTDNQVNWLLLLQHVP